MNAPIQALYQTAQTLYAVIVNNDDGTFWRVDTSVWEAYVAGHWSSYAVVMTEFAGSGIYRATYPIAAPLHLSSEVLFVRAGATPTLGDPPATSIYQSQGMNVAAVANLWVAGQNMGAALGSQQTGAIVGTPASATVLPTNLTNARVDSYAGRAVIMTSGVLIQQASFITGYDGAGALTIQGFVSGGTPANGDAFVIV